MLTALLALALTASPAKSQLVCETVKVCVVPTNCKCPPPAPKKLLRKKAVKTKVRAAPAVQKQAPVIININQNQQQQQSQTMAQPPATVTAVDTNPTFIVGLRGAGVGALCLPQGAVLLGLRARLPALHLGAELYTEFHWGHGLQLLLYPVQSRHIDWHLNAGLYWFYNRPYVLSDTPRKLDLTLGTGLEVMLIGPLYLTGDLRVRAPNPVALNQNSLRGMSVANTLGNSATQTQFMLGLMLRN